MRKIIFLDRDGVINIERGDYTYKVEDFIIVDGLIETLQYWKSVGYEFIVITNQGGISKKRYNHSDVINVHQYMVDCLKAAEIDLLDIYYCPHHATIEKCICRKPNSLMLEKAIARYDVDRENSYFIGDSRRDVLAAEKAGVKGVKIEPNEPLTKYMNELDITL